MEVALIVATSKQEPNQHRKDTLVESVRNQLHSYIMVKNMIRKLIRKHKLNKKQKEVNKLYEQDGLTDEVLDMQLEVNMMRNKLDIPDPKQRVYKGYCQ